MVGAPGYAQSKGGAQVFYAHGTPVVWDNSLGNYANLVGYATQPAARLGTAVAVGNYDPTDIYSDLAIGAPGQIDANDNPLGPRGSVHIYKGTAGGIAAFTGTLGLIYAPPDPATGYVYDQPNNLFGFSLVWGDPYDGVVPNDTSLIIGAPGTTSNTMGGVQAGRTFNMEAFYAVNPNFWNVIQTFMDPTPDNNERFGWDVAIGRRLGGTKDDIIVGIPYANLLPLNDAGEAYIWIY